MNIKNHTVNFHNGDKDFEELFKKIVYFKLKNLQVNNKKYYESLYNKSRQSPFTKECNKR
ncbi:hypothetical protein [Clostridium tepidiprofundi]|uniref:hypothetical protein n=1 Tax=Clostridium tepidiprofundi TaxID=420412 RepID=UPI000835A5B9|nr:hypothetical protein [Clostridium tepidiprofundi]